MVAQLQVKSQIKPERLPSGGTEAAQAAGSFGYLRAFDLAFALPAWASLTKRQGIIVTITEQLHAALDQADAVYKASDMSLGKKVTEMESVLAAVIVAVKQIDARLSE